MFTTLDSFDTEFSADSVEWCPVENFQNIFVCGTYQLAQEESASEDNSSEENASEENTSEETPKKRLGRIYVFKVVDGRKLELVQRLDVAAVLDMKWAHIRINEKILLAIANSDGRL